MAAAKYARTSGNWGVNGNWSSTSCAAAGATTFPTAGDDVTICNGISIAVESGAARTANSVTIDTGANATGLTFAAATSSLNVTNNVTISIPTGAVTKQINVGAGTLTVGGNVTLTGGSAAARDALLTVSTGLVTINGGLTINATVATSSTVSITNAAGRINVAGAAGVANGDALYVDAGTFNVTNPAATLTTTHTLATGIAVTTRVTSGTLAIAGNAVVDSGTTGLKTMSLTTGVITVGGTLSVTAAAATADAGDATVSVTTGRLTVAGNTTVTGGTTANRDALLTVTGAGAAGQGINIGGTLNIVAPTIAGSATVSSTNATGRITVSGAGGINNGDTLTVGIGLVSVTNAAATLTTTNTTGLAATTSVTSGTLAIAGNAVVDSGTNGLKQMTLTTGVITVGGTLSVTAAAATANTGDATVSVTTGRITVTGNVDLTGGSNANRDALLTVTGATALGNGINIGGTLNIASTVAGSSTVSLGTGSRVTLTGTGGINNGDTLSIGAGILTITNGGAALNNSNGAILATTTISSGTLSIVGHLNNAAGETMTLGSGNVIVGGNFTSNGTLTPGTSTVTLNGTAAQTISGTSPVTLRTLDVTNATNPNITLATNVVVNTLTGTVVLTSTCPTDYTLTSTTPAQVLHSCITPGGFNAFEPPVSPTTCATLPVATNSGPIKTKIAGTTYPLCVVALNSSPTPQIMTTFTGNVKVEVVPTLNCLTTPTVLATMSPVALATGRASLTFSAVANAYMDVSVRISYPTTSPTVVKCSTDKYAIRPNSLSFTVTDGDWETAGTTRTLNNVSTPGGTKHKAGRPFTITATAWNGAGTPAIATNYAGSPTASIASHIIPSTCLNGTACTLNGGTFEDGTAGDGIVTSTTASYAEVGAFKMQLIDTTFAAVDALDSTNSERYITSGTVDVGRFVPDHFSLSSGSRMPACTASGAVLSYMGQPFALAATLLAQNFAGGTTENYHPSGGGYAPATVAWQAENANSGTNLTARLVNASSTWNKGSYTVNSSTATFNRVAATTPDGPYDSLQLGIALTDPDGPVLGGLDMDAATSSDCTTTPPCTAVKVGAPVSARFGRLRLSNAFGAEQLSLNMPALLEYYDGSKWLPSATDNCTTFAALVGPSAALTLTPSGSTTPRCGVLTSTCTAASGFACNSANPVANGNLGLCLTAPSAKGFTDVPFGPIPAYLQFNAVTTPSARASFGIYSQGGNSKRIIYRRETR
ncbi:DUF6701 domain-containing protein [Sulfuritalea hydrogenivorans]|uniref:DUF6701 domain-containing protein n=1 Tax=Sulfuritalea hydrogenivorans sk43H TaxID=1223802 RepID=W0SC68_9PROT|nr:DUF6701 domain-containing protein [Sulfuritalea hydrogenivorans]BAO28641.1 hypothetical protein SUTH_00833 [Sulfuritalea hydrogenivorans sk43H]